jgi:FkbM family methyltransferase
MKRFLVRVTGWINRLFNSVERLGISNTIKIFFYARLYDGELKIVLPNSLPFTFRGKVNIGVISHFYNEVYFIEDSSEHRIKTILDGGANIGDETARFLFHYPDAEILAVEAAETNFDLLQRNFSKIESVKLVKGGLWSIKTNLKLLTGTSAESFSVVETDDNSDSIPAWTILELIQKMQWDKIDILKLDIEGFEYELFTRNFDEWIDKVNSFIIETTIPIFVAKTWF